MERDDTFRSKRLELAREASARVMARTMADRVLERTGRAPAGGVQRAPLADHDQQGRECGDGRDCHVRKPPDGL